MESSEKLLNSVQKPKFEIESHKSLDIHPITPRLDPNSEKIGLKRGRSLKSKFRALDLEKEINKNTPKKQRNFPSLWIIFCRIITFWAPDSLLKRCGFKQKEKRDAWREKMGLVSIIATMCLVVGFLTFGLQHMLCSEYKRVKINEITPSDVIVNGYALDVSKFGHPVSSITGADKASILGPPLRAGMTDLSFLFQDVNSDCKGILDYDEKFKDSNGNVLSVFPCEIIKKEEKDAPKSVNGYLSCHNSQTSRDALSSLYKRPISYSWEDVTNNPGWYIYNGAVIDMNRARWVLPGVKLSSSIQSIMNGTINGTDITLDLNKIFNKKHGKCILDLFTIGFVDTASLGCIASNIILYVSLMVILGAVFTKFFMSVYFGWFLSRRLDQFGNETPEQRLKRLEEIEAWANENNHYGYEKINQLYSVTNSGQNYEATKKSRFHLPKTSRYSQLMPGDEPGARDRASKKFGVYSNNTIAGPNSRQVSRVYSQRPSFATHSVYSNHHYSGSTSFRNINNIQSLYSSPAGDTNNTSVSIKNHKSTSTEVFLDYEPLYTLLMVTCYSEGAHGIRTTLDSLAGTEYPSKYKCMVIVCDGLIKGEGESITTPDVCLTMMYDFAIPPDKVQEYSYVAVANGSKRHNKAKIYAGYYKASENSPDSVKKLRIPMILIVKCGTSTEKTEKKPGNRGKRDSQVIVMSFLQRVMFDERMTRLEYEMFNAFWSVTGVTPDNFEIVLMVDADTKVYPDSLKQMVSVMAKDHMVMGLCGETKIANKRDSYTSMMQVFEYYISHHQTKAFESVFGGVTCLPGCFCMYRIKVPKGRNGYWVPILANPDIVENYSENVVDTLHKKNLLLLGEDRYLSTLMLKTFPKRKMKFVQSAVCKTIVPNEFKVLLSQRRRWINSTVHNLFELVLVNDLCGTFCFSMQFIIFMELVGTLVLPAAISFTLYIIVISTFTRPVPWLPLILLVLILGLPAVLIGLTSRKIVYVGWMLVYLSALFLWNFVLPVYAYWHFDDFSWGETRKIDGETTGHESEGEGVFDSSDIVMKRWGDFEAGKRRRIKSIVDGNPKLLSIFQTSLLYYSGEYKTKNGIGQATTLAQRALDLQIQAIVACAEDIERLGYTPPFTLSHITSISAEEANRNYDSAYSESIATKRPNSSSNSSVQSKN
ncbi:hypothetical protein BB559_000847 [Furculomyces boomerangus]|uniref:chitin synthase n=1 Tax=Furculomyces boomerangus TaxID=61424 RepID=A0A2T9Z3W9_9FUNG|nr:hypothetical protein BB559_000847 [Furculomyces boomerangus]